MILKAATAYFTGVFAIGLLLGTLRVLVVAPAVGDFFAVMIELPLILAAAWLVAGVVLKRWPVPRVQRLGMGALAFLLLMLAEVTLAALMGIDLRASLATPAGTAGLLGQIGFALIPSLKRP